MENDDKLSFFMNHTEFTIPICFNSFLKVSNNIKKSFFFQGGKYTVESIVRKEIFQNFIDSWVQEKELKIDVDNIWEYYLLSEEFELFRDILSKPEYENSLRLSYLKYVAQNNTDKTLNGNQKIDKSSAEGYIARNLDFYIENHSNYLCKISFSSLYNIFNHKERKLENHEKAYWFITNFGIDSGGTKFTGQFVLLPSIDCKKLHFETIIDSISKFEEHLGFLPKNSITILTSHAELYEKQKNTILNQKEQIKQMRNEIIHQQQLEQKAKEETQHVKNQMALIEEKRLSENQKYIIELNDLKLKQKMLNNNLLESLSNSRLLEDKLAQSEKEKNEMKIKYSYKIHELEEEIHMLRSQNTIKIKGYFSEENAIKNSITEDENDVNENEKKNKHKIS